MLRILLQIFQVQFLLLCIFLLCSGIAGEKNAAFWFVLVTLTLNALTVAGAVARRGR